MNPMENIGITQLKKTANDAKERTGITFFPSKYQDSGKGQIKKVSNYKVSSYDAREDPRL